MNPAAPVSILAIVVVYKVAPMRSDSLRTLLECVRSIPASEARIRVIVADNTPGGQTVEELPPEIEYRAYPDNPGLARPYNDALETAAQDGFDWLLTLDQDTYLPQDFLRVMTETTQLYPSDDVAAIVPRIVDGDRVISPFRYVAGFLPVILPRSADGVVPRHASAINSGSFLRVQTLRSLEGYDPRFPLHNSDTRLYQRLDNAGKQVAIADILVPHELAILDRENRMTPDRYRQTLLDECEFWDLHMGPAGRMERLVRLAGRTVKGMLRKEGSEYVRITMQEFRRRLLIRRKTRLRAQEAV